MEYDKICEIIIPGRPVPAVKGHEKAAAEFAEKVREEWKRKHPGVEFEPPIAINMEFIYGMATKKNTGRFKHRPEVHPETFSKIEHLVPPVMAGLSGAAFPNSGYVEDVTASKRAGSLELTRIIVYGTPVEKEEKEG